VTNTKTGAGRCRRDRLTKAQREQQARWLELLRPQDEPPAAPEEREQSSERQGNR